MGNRKRPVLRCGNCKRFPGNDRICIYNTWTGGMWKTVKAWDYACAKFINKGTWER